MLAALLGRKVGMTQVFGPNGTAIPVTVIEAGPCIVTQIKTAARDGYEAVQIGFEQVNPVDTKLGKVRPLTAKLFEPLIAGISQYVDERVQDVSVHELLPAALQIRIEQVPPRLALVFA